MNFKKGLVAITGALGPPQGPAFYVQRLLKRKELSASQAAELIGVNQSTLSRFLNGSALTVDMAVKLNKGLGIDVQTLFNLDAQAKTHEAGQLLNAS